MIKDRANLLVKDNFVEKFIEKNFNFDEREEVVNYLLLHSDEDPLEELKKLFANCIAYTIEETGDIEHYINKLIVNLILLNVVTVEQLNKLKSMGGNKIYG